MAPLQGGNELVGPVLIDSELSRAVIAVLQRHNTGLQLLDRGSYLRVLVPKRCAVTRLALETALGRSFQLPGDLEALMPSFQGHLRIADDEVSWSAEFEGGR